MKWDLIATATTMTERIALSSATSVSSERKKGRDSNHKSGPLRFWRAFIER